MLPLSMATTIQAGGGVEGAAEFGLLPPIRTNSSRRFELSRRQALVCVDAAVSVASEVGVAPEKLQEQASADHDKQLGGGARSEAGYESYHAVVEECVTPKSDHHILQPVLVCPSAPRKPRPAKRKHFSDDDDNQTRRYFVVSVDLAMVFIARPPPPKWRKTTGQGIAPQLS